MPETKYLVTLTADERTYPDALIRKGKAAALVLARARVLLKADQADGGPAWDGARLAEAVGVGERTVARVRQRFGERGFEACRERKPQDRPGRERKLDGAAEARLVAIACSTAPDGRAEWTTPLLADQLVELAVVDAISDETVRRTPKKMRSSRGRRSSGACPVGRAGSS